MQDTKDRMNKAVEALKKELQTIRTGRANPTMLDRVEAEYYGTMTPVKNMANISVSEGRTLVVMPFDKGSLKAIEKAIQDSDMGFNPNNDGNRILISIPELTGQRREELAKLVRKEAENARVSVRNIRRDEMEHIKKNKDLSEDESKRNQDELEKLTASFIKNIDEVSLAKEKEITTI